MAKQPRGGRSNGKRSTKSNAAARRQDDALWRIRFHKNVKITDAADVGHASMQLARKVIDKKLKVDPLGYGEPLRGDLKGLYKLKTSDVRIAYWVVEAEHEVWVLMIGNRRDIWDEATQTIVSRKGEAVELSVRPRPADAPAK